jgi:hypothetical protein
MDLPVRRVILVKDKNSLCTKSMLTPLIVDGGVSSCSWSACGDEKLVGQKLDQRLATEGANESKLVDHTRSMYLTVIKTGDFA